MQAYQVIGVGQSDLREVPVPEPGPSEVRLKVAAAGVCHSDLRLIQFAASRYELPMTLGHEIGGHVDQIGAGVVGWEQGQPALVYLSEGCGSCRNCLASAENYCLSFPRGSVPGPGMGRHGGMAEYVTVAARQLLPLGDLDPVRAAPLADAGLTPYHAIHQARHRLTDGATAVVIGVGGLGNLAVQILVATTPVQVIAVDVDEQRLQMAQERGAKHVVHAGPEASKEILRLTAGAGAELVLDLVGRDGTLAIAAESVGSFGCISAVGLDGGTLPFVATAPPVGLPWGASLVKTYGGTRDDLNQVLALARRSLLEVPVEQFPLKEARQVLQRLDSGAVMGRAVLVP